VVGHASNRAPTHLHAPPLQGPGRLDRESTHKRGLPAAGVRSMLHGACVLPMLYSCACMLTLSPSAALLLLPASHPLLAVPLGRVPVVTELRWGAWVCKGSRPQCVAHSLAGSHRTGLNGTGALVQVSLSCECVRQLVLHSCFNEVASHTLITHTLKGCSPREPHPKPKHRLSAVV